MTIKDFIAEHITPDQDGPTNLPFQIGKKTLNKGTVLTNYGQIEKNGYFLKKGIILCEIERNDAKTLIDIVFPGNFFCAYNSFLLDEPSDIRVFAFTACEIEFLEKEELKSAYHHSLLANKLGRYLKEHLLLKKVQREKDFLTKTAEEVYTEILRENPGIIQNLPVNKIAQYLGIHSESLSRIRKKLIT